MAEKQIAAGSVGIQGTGIQTKILLFLALALATLAAVAGGLAYATQNRTLNADLETRGQSHAALVARQAERVATANAVPPTLLADGSVAPQAPPTVTLDDLVEDAGLAVDVQRVVILDAQGSVVAPRALRGQTPPSTDGIMVSAPVGEGRGSVQVVMDQSRVDDLSNQALTTQVGFFSAAALLLGLIGLFVVNSSVRPLKLLAELAIDLDRGEAVDLAKVEGSDEVGVIASSLNSAIGQLRVLETTSRDLGAERETMGQLERSIAGLLEVTIQLSEGDLTARGDVTADALGAVSDAINVVAEEIGELLNDVRLAATTVAGGSQEMIEATENIVSGAGAQVEASERVRAQVMAVTETVRQVSGGAQESAQAARQTLEASKQGQESVDQMRERMQRIRSEVQGISRRIKSLGDRSLEISEIVEAISGISSQTNLLALNAAIEASGAGEEGARFAVVADEVRTLAEDTAKATKRIDSLISSVQAEIQDAVVAMEEGTSEVEMGFQVTNQAGERLSEIERLSESSAQTAERISSAASSQVSQVEAVADATNAIATTAATGESSAVDGRRIAEQVGRLAAELLESLSRFTLANR